MSTEDEKLLKEAKKLPWDERLQHKNWKVRNDANIDLAALCDSITDPKDARLREFGETPTMRLPIRPISRSDLHHARFVHSLWRYEMSFFGARSDVLLWWLGPLFKKTVADSNAPVQEKALDALLAFQRAADADASRYVCALRCRVISHYYASDYLYLQ